MKGCKMFVTDKNYHLEDEFTKKVTLFLKRREKNWDHLLLYDGDEGVGKSTCAVHHAYYIAELLGKKFSHKNIFFDPEKMMKFASETEGEVIMWDEAAFGGMSAQWQNQIQQKLIMCLMTARKKRHVWLFLIPELHKLNFYFIKRSVGIIHVYSQDDINRGKYVYFGKSRKNRYIIPQLLAASKKKMISFKKYSFRGAFGKDALISELIDEGAYEKAKDEAIMKAFSGDSAGNIWKERAVRYHHMLYVISEHCKLHYGMSQAHMARILGTNDRLIGRGKDLPEKHPEIFRNKGNRPRQPT